LNFTHSVKGEEKVTLVRAFWKKKRGGSKAGRRRVNECCWKKPRKYQVSPKVGPCKMRGLSRGGYSCHWPWRVILLKQEWGVKGKTKP